MIPVTSVLIPASSYNLTVIETVRADLGITDHDEDENLARWIMQASGAIARHCKRVFARETVRDIFRQECSESDKKLFLSRYPIMSITSVIESGSTLAITDYEIDSESGSITRLAGDYPTSWSSGKTIIDYSAGYTLLQELPHDVERACIQLVGQYRHDASRALNIRSETVDGIGSRSYFDYGDKGIPPEIRSILDPFCNRRQD